MAPFFLGCTHGHFEPFHYEKLVRLCGMLTSDFPGERANAAQKASAFIKQAGLTWRDIIIPPPRADNQHQAGASASTAGDWVPDDWHDRAEEILASGRATQWERDFCAHLTGEWDGDLTDKQEAVLNRIY